GPVEADVVGDQAEGLPRLGEGVELRRLEERFGGDAAADQTGAAHPVLLDDGSFGTQLRRAQGGDVAARAAADHRYVKSPRHSSYLYLPSTGIMPSGRAFPPAELRLGCTGSRSACAGPDRTLAREWPGPGCGGIGAAGTRSSW